MPYRRTSPSGRPCSHDDFYRAEPTTDSQAWGGEEEMNGNQIKLLYAGGAWFAGLFIYRCGSVPGGWGLLGDALGFTIGYSALPRCR